MFYIRLMFYAIMRIPLFLLKSFESEFSFSSYKSMKNHFLDTHMLVHILVVMSAHLKFPFTRKQLPLFCKKKSFSFKVIYVVFLLILCLEKRKARITIRKILATNIIFHSTKIEAKALCCIFDT